MKEETLIALAEQYLREEPYEPYRHEIRDLLHQFPKDKKARLELEDRLVGSMQFGTAGLRAKMQAGYRRFNRVSIAKSAWALGQYLLETASNPKEVQKKGVVVGFDARNNSESAAEECASVLTGLGFQVFIFTKIIPTPICAFVVSHLQASMGIMITASHNPPLDNGLKAYGAHGAQITSPTDRQIESWIEKAPLYFDLPHLEIAQQCRKKLRHSIKEETIESYFAAVSNAKFHDVKNADAIEIVYTPLHGVGKEFARRALNDAGFRRIHIVESQAEPNGDFPTVSFPNPEEKGTLDEAIAFADKVHAELILANDPDADRLAVIVRHPESGQLVSLTGNEIGVLLGADAIANAPKNASPLVISTIVSSQMLAQIAKVENVRYKETLTGFSKIASVAMDLEKNENAQFIFGYEEALGYCVGNLVRDKDGISAAVRFAELFASLKENKQSVFDQLDQLSLKYGLFRSRQWSIRFEGIGSAKKMQKRMESLRTDSQLMASLDGKPVLKREDYLLHSDLNYRDNILLYAVQNEIRLIVRPSGTEPKIKFYLEMMRQVGPNDDLKLIRAKLDVQLQTIQEQIEKQFELI